MPAIYNCSARPLGCVKMVQPTASDMNWSIWRFCSKQCALNLRKDIRNRQSQAFQSDLLNSGYRLPIYCQSQSNPNVFLWKSGKGALVTWNVGSKPAIAQNPLGQPTPTRPVPNSWVAGQCSTCGITLPMSWRQKVSGVWCGSCKAADSIAQWKQHGKAAVTATAAQHGMTVSMSSMSMNRYQSPYGATARQVEAAVNVAGTTCTCDMTNGLSGCHCGAFKREQQAKACDKCGRKGG